MTFFVKLDENLGKTHVRFLRELGYEADRVHDQGLSGANDERVWARVCAEGRFLITLDLDFSDVRRYRPGSHPGILCQVMQTASASPLARGYTFQIP